MDKATHFSQRLSFRQTRYALIVAFIIGLAFSFLQIALDYRQQNLAIDQEISALLEISSAPASRIAYNIDTELAQELLNGLIRSPAIISAEIRDDSNQQLGYVQRDRKQDQARWISDSLFGRNRIYRHDLRVDYDPEEQLGYLQFEVDTFNYGDTFIRRALTTFITGLIKGFAMALILLLLFYRMLTKPLTSVTKALSRLRSHESSPPRLACPEGHTHDEIGLLVEEVNNLLYGISSNSKRRFRAERQLRDHLSTLEKNIANRTSELNARNKQLTNSNRELEQAKKEALQIAQARATMLASMSHEIRTPLSSLLGMIDLATMNADAPAQKRRLVLAHESGHQLLQLLTDILDFSRFESNKLIFESIDFNLHQTIEKTVELFSQQAAQKQICLQCIITTSVPQNVEGDPTRLQQIITNLISNALKFTHYGYIAVYVKAEKTPAGIKLIATVSDTGIGIATDRIETIFQPFSQASSDTNRLYGGSGLGLALSRDMAEAMGGKLQARKGHNDGTCFELMIPYAVNADRALKTEFQPLRTKQTVTILAPSVQAQALAHYLKEAGSQPCLLSWHGPWPSSNYQTIKNSILITPLERTTLDIQPDLYIPIYNPTQNHGIETEETFILAPVRKTAVFDLLTRLSQSSPDIICKPAAALRRQPPENTSRYAVLIVEDNPTNLMVTEGILAQAGYRVSTARNGQQCLDICEKETFDLIFMDCNMPVMNGYDASSKLRQSSKFQHIPIIALTANAFERDRDRCLQHGMQDYIGKPFDRKKLEEKMRYWLSTDITQSPEPSSEASSVSENAKETELTQ